jgi:hypothetical protein
VEAGDLVNSIDDVLLALREGVLPPGDTLRATEDDLFDDDGPYGPFDPPRVPLTTDLWRHDYEPEDNRIVTVERGLHVYHVRIRILREPVEHLFFAPEPVGGEARPVGRPTLMPELAVEMRRRAAAGQLAPTPGAEFQYLRKWGQCEFPGEYIPSAKWIGEKLGSLYRELKAKARG